MHIAVYNKVENFVKVWCAMVQNVQADYSMESHARDLDNYVNIARNRRRRAKALLDFERHDDDELGFRKNDIITVSCCSLSFSRLFLTDCIHLFQLYFSFFG